MNPRPADNLPQRVPNPVRAYEAPKSVVESVEDKALRYARGGASDEDIRIVCGLKAHEMRRLQKRIDRARRECRVRLHLRLVQSALEGKVPAIKALLAEEGKSRQEEEEVDLPDVPPEWG